MFQNICGSDLSRKGSCKVVASGFYVEDSHYVVIIQSMTGEVLDLNVTELEEPEF